MSPSEEKGIALGLVLLKFERHKRTESIDGKRVSTGVYAQFESPPIGTKRSKWETRRHVLHSYSKSRAGAWRHAIRWLRALEAGKLR